MWNQQLQSLNSEKPKENGEASDDESKKLNAVSRRSSGGHGGGVTIHPRKS